jgi:hypothetical protein
MPTETLLNIKEGSMMIGTPKDIIFARTQNLGREQARSKGG